MDHLKNQLKKLHAMYYKCLKTLQRVYFEKLIIDKYIFLFI